MSFAESNTVEQIILDAATSLGSGAGSSVLREEPPAGWGGSLGEEFKPSRWIYVAATALPRHPGEVMVEPWVRDALISLNPEISDQPDRADEVIYALRAILLSGQGDGLVRANWIFMASLRGEKTMPFIDRADMSPELRRSAGSAGTVSNLGRAGFGEEIERLIGTERLLVPISEDPIVEDAASFALEKHLEDFLVDNWGQTELGREYDIYSDEGEIAGQQFQTDIGPLYILAISKDGKRLLVVELKKGRASDSGVGQTLQYMGYVADELAEDGQMVHGAVIPHEDDPRIPGETLDLEAVSRSLFRTTSLERRSTNPSQPPCEGGLGRPHQTPSDLGQFHRGRPTAKH